MEVVGDAADTDAETGATSRRYVQLALLLNWVSIDSTPEDAAAKRNRRVCQKGTPVFVLAQECKRRLVGQVSIANIEFSSGE